MGSLHLSANILMGFNTKQRLDGTLKVVFHPHVSLDCQVKCVIL